MEYCCPSLLVDGYRARECTPLADILGYSFESIDQFRYTQLLLFQYIQRFLVSDRHSISRAKGATMVRTECKYVYLLYGINGHRRYSSIVQADLFLDGCRTVGNASVNLFWSGSGIHLPENSASRNDPSREPYISYGGYHFWGTAIWVGAQRICC